MKILVVDVGGNNVKLLVSGRRPREGALGPALTAARMATFVRKAVADWRYDAVAIGFPGPVSRRPPRAGAHEPRPGLGALRLRPCLGRAVRLVDDAVMQALSSYRRRMLFLASAPAWGVALVVEGHVQPLEIAHLRTTTEDVRG